MMIEKSDKFITSEEKLLKLIRRKEQQHKAAARTGEKPPAQALPGGLTVQRRDWLALANRGLTGIVAVLAAYLFIKVLFVPSPNVEEVAVEATAETAAPAAPGTTLQPVGTYLDVMEKRNIFSTSFKSDETGEEIPIVTAPTATDEPLQGLRLVGIVMDSNPQAIIEDVREKQTYFLFKGESVNTVVVEDISAGKVVVSHGGQTYELKNE